MGAVYRWGALLVVLLLSLTGCASTPPQPDPLAEYLQRYYELRQQASPEQRLELDAQHERFMRDLYLLRGLQPPSAAPSSRSCFSLNEPGGRRSPGWTYTACD